MDEGDDRTIRQLFDEYIRMYSTRDDRLTAHFSEDFSGFTGGGDFLVKDKARWVAITRQDFAQVKEPIAIEVKDVAIQSLAATVAVATSFFTIHLPIKDHVLSRETARLVLIFRKEAAGWLISHSSISIPYHLVREGEVYPMQELVERNQFLEELVSERTSQLSAANESLRRTNEELTREMAERRSADAAREKSEEIYRSILTASPDDITITDQEGRIVMVSPMAYTIFGYPRDQDFSGRSVMEFLLPEDRAHAASQLALKRQGVVTGPSEYRALHQDGHVLDIEVNSEFILNAAGVPAGMVVIVRDITGRKRAAAEAEQMEALNRQLQKVESLGRMAGAIAHHFNNDLQAVMLSVESAIDDLAPGAGALESLADAMRSARKAAEVSGSMLTYLGQRTGKQEALELGEACLRSMSLLRAFIPAGVVLESDFPARGPVVSANESEVQQVLANLTTNAREAMGDRHGTIRLTVKTVAAAEIPAENRFPVGCRLHDTPHACLEVADAGCGIAHGNIEKVFDPFFSSKFAGRGLGLPVVLGIVRAHAGAITVESEPDVGSTFRVFLPVAAQAVPRKAVPVGLPPRASAHRTVLVVDDEPLVRKAFSRALRTLGYAVLEAEDGLAAVELFGQRRAEISCVVCDVTMPRMGGWETLTALRELAPGLPVILASGYSQDQVMAGDHPEWPQAFLSKPCDSRELVSALERALAGEGEQGRALPRPA
jgi:two-component system, cell cycle sensor histidine kinase and response regulator CckA